MNYLKKKDNCNIFFTKQYNLFIGDIGSGKTTIIQHIIRNHFDVNDFITSCTYCYYAKYKYNNIDIVHMDMYKNTDINSAFIVFEMYSRAIYFIEFGKPLINIVRDYMIIFIDDLYIEIGTYA